MRVFVCVGVFPDSQSLFHSQHALTCPVPCVLLLLCVSGAALPRDSQPHGAVQPTAGGCRVRGTVAAGSKQGCCAASCCRCGAKVSNTLSQRTQDSHVSVTDCMRASACTIARPLYCIILPHWQWLQVGSPTSWPTRVCGRFIMCAASYSSFTPCVTPQVPLHGSRCPP